MRVNGYDGVDLDWEFPRSATDREGLTALVIGLRAVLGVGKTLSIDGPASDYSGQWLDIPALAPSLDWVAALTYPLSSASWSTYSGHSSPLYSGVGQEQAAAQGRNNWNSIDSSRTYYLGRGLPAAKLLIGLPFFGMRFDSATDIDQPLASTAGDAMDYRDVAPLIGHGWTPYHDDGAATPYLVREGGPGLISYDDPASISQKCRYTAADGLGGVILWHLGKDAINGDQPLLRAAAGCR